MDFCREKEMDVQLGKGLWRIKGQEWHEFASCQYQRQDGEIFAECAGICELINEQRQKIQGLVNNLVIPQGVEHGVSNLTEHSIHVTDPRPIKHRPRRMSPMMLHWLINEVKKLLEQGIIERASS